MTRRVSTASGSERVSTSSTLATARGTDPFTQSQTALELQAQRELNQARASKRPAGCSDRRGSGGADGLGNPAEIGAAAVAHRVGEICVVEEIEEIGFKSQPSAFPIEREVLRHLEIPVVQSGAVILVASRCAHPA